MKKTNFLYKEPILSWDKALVHQGMFKGVYAGFDVMNIALNGSNYEITLSHSDNFKHIGVDGINTGNLGAFISPQGIQHVTDESIMVVIPSNTGTETRRDIIVAELVYITSAGNPNDPTYTSVQGTVGSTSLPSIPLPDNQISLGSLNVKGIGTGSINVNDIQFIPTPTQVSGNKMVKSLSGISQSMVSADNLTSLGIINAQDNIIFTNQPTGDPYDNDINNRPVLIMNKDTGFSNKIFLLGSWTSGKWITDLVINKDNFDDTRTFESNNDFLGTNIELINNTGVDITLGLPDGITTENSTIYGYNVDSEKNYVLKNGDSCTLTRLRFVILGSTTAVWFIKDFSLNTRTIGDPDTLITSENYIAKENTIQENLTVLDSWLYQKTQDIATNASNIDTNASNIDTNASNIATNIDSINYLGGVIGGIRWNYIKTINSVTAILLGGCGLSETTTCSIIYSRVNNPYINPAVSSPGSEYLFVNMKIIMEFNISAGGTPWDTTGLAAHLNYITINKDLILHFAASTGFSSEFTYIAADYTDALNDTQFLGTGLTITGEVLSDVNKPVSVPYLLYNRDTSQGMVFDFEKVFLGNQPNLQVLASNASLSGKLGVIIDTIVKLKLKS